MKKVDETSRQKCMTVSNFFSHLSCSVCWPAFRGITATFWVGVCIKTDLIHVMAHIVRPVFPKNLNMASMNSAEVIILSHEFVFQAYYHIVRCLDATLSLYPMARDLLLSHTLIYFFSLVFGTHQLALSAWFKYCISVTSFCTTICQASDFPGLMPLSSRTRGRWSQINPSAGPMRSSKPTFP